jgi:hypothetical protein
MKVVKFVPEEGLTTISYFVTYAFNKTIHYAHDTEDNVYVWA